jgi:hypothetical protein
MKIFKTNNHLCKKTDDYGKKILNYQIKTEPIQNSSNLSSIEKLFYYDSELYPFYNSNFDINRMTKSTINNKLISNFVTDNVLNHTSKLNNMFILHNYEINEAGIGGHHQIKSTATMIMLLLKTIHSTTDKDKCVSFNIKYTIDGEIDEENSTIFLWKIIKQHTNECCAELIDFDYQFKTNIILDFMSLELPTFHSAVNTQLISTYFDQIQNTISDRLINYPFCDLTSYDLDSNKTTLSRDSKGCYNKFGYVNNSWYYPEPISSYNVFKVLQLILKYNNIHFNKPDKMEYTNEMMQQIRIGTVSPYGFVDLIKNYNQRDNYIKTYSSKLFNLLNGSYGSISFNVTPDFIRLTEYTEEIEHYLIEPTYKYYATYNDKLYVSYSDLKENYYHRTDLEKIIMNAIKLNIKPWEDFMCFINYFKRISNSNITLNRSYIELNFDNLMKMLSVNLKPDNYKIDLKFKIPMIDYRLYKILM